MCEGEMNKPLSHLILAVLVSVFVSSSAQTAKAPGEDPTALQVLQAVDRVRNPAQPFKTTLALAEYVSGKERDRTSLIVYARQDPDSLQFNNLVRYAQPRRDAGKMVLFKGVNLWFYDPASEASVRISPQQRLVGQASEGDVLAVNLSRDYTARIVGVETLQDADRQNRDCWHLDMAATTPDAIYSRIEYWVERSTYRPIKGKFYSDSGRLLKIAYYHNYQQQLGSFRPMETILIDGVNQNLATIIDNSDYQLQNIPEAWFQRDYLPRLRPE
jgi:outer membrane lipoprotein-sorting protein